MTVYKCTKCQKLFESYGKEKCDICGSEVEPPNEYEEAKFLKGKELCQQIMDSLNTMGMEGVFGDGFIAGVCSTHRSLQQDFCGLLQRCILHFASMNKEGWHDQRNEATVKLCAELAKVVKEKGWVRESERTS